MSSTMTSGMMTKSSVDAIARTVLYEGYSLYPYRESSLKNRRRVLFGTLFPHAWTAVNDTTGDACEATAECLLLASSMQDARIGICVRFLRLMVGGAEAKEESIVIDDISIAALLAHELEKPFTLDDDDNVGAGALIGRLDVRASTMTQGVASVRVTIRNLTPTLSNLSREEAELVGFGAAHIVLRLVVDGGGRGGNNGNAKWISLTDPPAAYAELASRCEQHGLWPVLVGADAILASPIILYDQPEIAAESAAGDLFDATEIEEILALRIQTLTEDEKAELRRSATTRALLERVDGLNVDELRRLHGTLRRSRQEQELAIGDSVIVRPNARPRADASPNARTDALDILLASMNATIVSIEETLEGEELVCVTIDRDPGRDLGERGFPGHRFFFRPDEIEKIAKP